jgi:hypothetical protein
MRRIAHTENLARTPHVRPIVTAKEKPMQTRFIMASSLLFGLAACGDDPLNYSAPVGINLKAKSSDTVNNVVSDDKGINTESGNPYGAFVTDARRELGGVDPATIEVEGVDIFLGAASTGVATLGEIFDGNVEVLFQMNDTNNSYPVAHGIVGATTDAGPYALEVDFVGADIPDIDYEKLLGGSFKVIARGPAAADFTSKGADADLQVTFTFAAFE